MDEVQQKKESKWKYITNEKIEKIIEIKSIASRWNQHEHYAII